MTFDQEFDAVAGALRQLATPAPSPQRAERTRARCHDAMARPRGGRTRVIDALLGVAVALYGAAIVTEGLRVLLR